MTHLSFHPHVVDVFAKASHRGKLT